MLSLLLAVVGCAGSVACDVELVLDSNIVGEIAVAVDTMLSRVWA